MLATCSIPNNYHHSNIRQAIQWYTPEEQNLNSENPSQGVIKPHLELSRTSYIYALILNWVHTHTEEH